MNFFTLENSHSTITHEHDRLFRLSDIVSFEQGHIHIHFGPIIVILAMITIIGVGIWGLVNPKAANQPVPNSVLVPVGIVVLIIVIWVVIAQMIYGGL